ncbi:MAG: hypothetical protein ABW252_20770 [Polyangiales bacterium]
MSGLRACIAASSVLAPGCLAAQRHELPADPIAITADAQPAFVGENDEPVFRAEQRTMLHLTPPTDAERASLAAQPTPPYPRAPWIALDDLELQLDYALESASDMPVVVDVTLDGINEFHAYAPGPEDLHQWARRLALAPRERITGTVTELELHEVAVDLATVVNGAPNSNLVVDPRSQAGRDPRVAAFVPARIPGLIGVLVGLESARAAALTLRFTIRVQDHGERATRRGERAWTAPAPAPFTPVAPEVD